MVRRGGETGRGSGRKGQVGVAAAVAVVVATAAQAAGLQQPLIEATGITAGVAGGAAVLSQGVHLGEEGRLRAAAAAEGLVVVVLVVEPGAGARRGVNQGAARTC